MLLPIKSKNPPESLPIGTIALIVVNVVIYIATADQGIQIKEPILRQWGLTGNNFGPVHMLTSMFLHGSPLHLIGNMWFLYLFGFAVEGRLRTLKFFAVYFGAGFAGDLLHQLLLGASHPEIPSIGASGAIMGTLGAALYIFPHGQVRFFYWWGFIRMGTFDWPMWGVALMYVGLDVLEAMIFAGRDGVGHLAHIGGALGGFLVCLAFRPQRDDEFVSQAKATFSDTQDLRTLTKTELAELARVNPANTAVVLNWMHKSLSQAGGVKPECQETFLRSIPKMMQEQEIGPIAYCVGALAQAPGVVHSRILIETASRLERVGDNLTAMRMYDLILKDPAASEGDQEAATFRVGLLAESAFSNYHQAMAAYQEVIRRWPMSPFAEQAAARLKVVSVRAVTPS